MNGRTLSRGDPIADRLVPEISKVARQYASPFFPPLLHAALLEVPAYRRRSLFLTDTFFVAVNETREKIHEDYNTATEHPQATSPDDGQGWLPKYLANGENPQR
jgi:hypothetical protein